MDKKELVMKVLDEIGMVDAEYISCRIKRVYGETVSRAQVSGILRPMVAAGKVGKSNCGYGKTVYWINERCFK